MAELAKHGIALPPEMVGLTDEQVTDLKLQDTQADIAVPSGGYQTHRDPIGRRNGRAPKDNMAGVLNKAMDEAAAMVSKVRRVEAMRHAAWDTCDYTEKWVRSY